MKYPIEQQKVFEHFCKQLHVHIDIKTINAHALHFICFQQFNDGQKHNRLYCTVNGLKKESNLTEIEKNDCQRLFGGDYDFLLYPYGCNDNHIETMVKKTLKNLFD